jgi:hypothetical protein
MKRSYWLAMTASVALLLGACGSDDPEVADCSSALELKNADIAGGTTLPAGTCYLVNENLTLSSGTVIAKAGVVLKFATDISFSVKTGGKLKLDGTAAAPVRFTSQDAVAFWKGVSFTDSQSSDNAWTYAEIDRAGSTKWSGALYSSAAVYLTGSTAISMDHVTISNSKSHGLVAFDKVNLTFSAGSFKNNETPAYLHPQVADAFPVDTAFSGNTNEYIRLVFGNNDTVAGTHTWPAHRFRMENRFFVSGDVTVDPGATLEFAQDASMIVLKGATLTAKGTAAKPVTFKGAANTKGFWKGIEIKSGGVGTPATIGATFDHSVISDAGGKAWSGAKESLAALFLQDTSAAAVTNTTFSNSARYGLWAGDKARITGFANNTFTKNTRVMLLHPDRVGELAGNSSISGNDDDGVYLVFGNNDRVSAAATWKDLKVSYVVTERFFIEAALTINAGVTILFPQERGVIVKETGSITTVGTASAPVTLRGKNEIATGYWKGINIESNSANNKLTHTTITNAGVKTWTGDTESDAAIYIKDSSQITLDNVTIGPGGGYGVFLADPSSTISCNATTFSSLVKGAVWKDDPSPGGVLGACP